MFCTCGYFATSTITQELECPICHSTLLVRSKEDQGREAWRVLHACETPTPEWYEGWLRMIPSYGCVCRDNWRKITAANPPDFSSLDAFRQWAIKRHDDVNRELGKPLWQRGD